MRTKAPYRLLYNNDNTNVAGVISPWREEGEDFREEMLVASIEEVADTAVDAYLLSPGMGWVPWWQSEVEPGFYDWWRERTGLSLEGFKAYDRYVAEGGDMVQVLVDTCRRLNMAPFVSLRMNDVHHQEHYVDKSERSIVSCRFYVEHPEWHIDPEHPRKKGYYKRRGMDWAVPEVRTYKLALLRELVDKYDLAGLELDFLRDETLFRDELPNDERIRIITEFAGQVRAALDSKAGPRRWLGIRMPLQLERCTPIGLEPEALHEAGVDIFNLSGWYHTTQTTDVATFRERLPDAAIYVEMTHSVGSHRYFIDNKLYGCDGDPRTSDHEYYTTAELAQARGADGMSLFNFVYYRRRPNTPDIPEMEPPFHVLSQITDTAFLARQHKVYTLAATYYRRQVPRRIEPGKTETFSMDMLKPTGHDANGVGRLRIHMLDACPDNLQVSVSVNGTPLEPTTDLSRFYGNPFDRMISPLPHRRAWTVPPETVVDGKNEIAVSTDQPVEAIYIDCAMP